MRAAHVHPEEVSDYYLMKFTHGFQSVKMHIELRSEFSIGTHWGTFPLTSEVLSQYFHVICFTYELARSRASQATKREFRQV